MAETVKVNFALGPETIKGIELLANETHRTKSNVVEWLVADALDRINQIQRASISVADVMVAGEPAAKVG